MVTAMTDSELDARLSAHLGGLSNNNDYGGPARLSSTGDGALIVLEAMRGRGWVVGIDCYISGLCEVAVYTPRMFLAAAAAPPRAVAEAANAALEAENVSAARPPSARTLARYGLDEGGWRAILRRQKGGCGVCGRVPLSGRLHVDHEHVRGWGLMPPARRSEFVRGLACWGCNSIWLRRGASPERLRAAARYLERYERGKR